MIALAGKVKGNSVILEDDSFVIPSDRAERRRNFFQSKKSVILSGRTAEEMDQELKLRDDRF